jgi:hypothetical protein
MLHVVAVYSLRVEKLKMYIFLSPASISKARDQQRYELTGMAHGASNDSCIIIILYSMMEKD